MEIKIENVKAAFNTADESGKKLLLALFPELSSETAQKADNRPVTERIKTFEDAMLELGEEHPFVKEWHLGENLSPELEAYLQLRVICAALNEGWEPKFTEEESRWYPWFWLYTIDEIERMDEQQKQDRNLMFTGDYITDYAGFACARSNYAPSSTNARIGSRLCLKSEALAVYCGKQFIDLWADFNLVRRR